MESVFLAWLGGVTLASIGIGTYEHFKYRKRFSWPKMVYDWEHDGL